MSVLFTVLYVTFVTYVFVELADRKLRVSMDINRDLKEVE